GLDADGAAPVVLDDGGQEPSVEPVEAPAVNTLLVERVVSDRCGDDAAARHLGVIADPTEQTIHDPRRTARAPGDLACSPRLDLRPEDLGRSEHDAGQFGLGIEVEVVKDPEALPER